MKAETIFDAVALELGNRSHNLNQLRYRRYLLAVHAFTKKKQQELSSERKHIASGLKKAEEEKRTLINQRAEMISQKLYDTHTNEQFEARIDELTDTIEDLKHRRKIGFENATSRILTFYKFLELRENLVQYWNFADFEKKAIFSKIILWNLTLRGQEVAIFSFKKPFYDDEEGGSDSNGAPHEAQLEPELKRLWNRLQTRNNEESLVEIMKMIDTCKPAKPLKFPVVADMEEVSGI